AARLPLRAEKTVHRPVRLARRVEEPPLGHRSFRGGEQGRADAMPPVRPGNDEQRDERPPEEAGRLQADEADRLLAGIGDKEAATPSAPDDVVGARLVT